MDKVEMIILVRLGNTPFVASLRLMRQDRQINLFFWGGGEITTSEKSRMIEFFCFEQTCKHSSKLRERVTY